MAHKFRILRVHLRGDRKWPIVSWEIFFMFHHRGTRTMTFNNSRWWSLLLLFCLSLALVAATQEDDPSSGSVSVDEDAPPAVPVISEENTAPSTPPGFEPLDTSKIAGESFQFETQVNRLMKLIINSLYKSKDIFLRELISVRRVSFLTWTRALTKCSVECRRMPRMPSTRFGTSS